MDDTSELRVLAGSFPSFFFVRQDTKIPIFNPVYVYRILNTSIDKAPAMQSGLIDRLGYLVTFWKPE